MLYRGQYYTILYYTTLLRQEAFKLGSGCLYVLYRIYHGQLDRELGTRKEHSAALGHVRSTPLNLEGDDKKKSSSRGHGEK
jgi:hypothetical protein